MAFDRLVTLRTDLTGNDVIVYDNQRYATFTIFGEYILAPVLMDVSQFGFRPAAAANLRVPYNPVIVFGIYTTAQGSTNNNLWGYFEVDGMRYTMESLQITNGNRFIELAGGSGVRISTGG